MLREISKHTYWWGVLVGAAFSYVLASFIVPGTVTSRTTVDLCPDNIHAQPNSLRMTITQVRRPFVLLLTHDDNTAEF
jgi:hypothetical protein